MSLTLLPADLAGTIPNPDTPWRVSKELFKKLQFRPDQQDSYTSCDITEADREYKFVHASFNYQIPTNRMIGRIRCIHNPQMTRAFETKIHSMEEQARDPYFASNWPEGDPSFVKELRKATLAFWEEEVRPFSPFYIRSKKEDGTERKDEYEHVKILPLWHGSSDEKCDSIARLRFARFGKHDFAQGGTDKKSTDIGIFGDGIYFTTSPKYAAEVYGDGHLLLSWVAMRKPFPIVSDEIAVPPLEPRDIQILKGRRAYGAHDAHYSHVLPVRGTNGKLYHYPCGQGQKPLYNEYVVDDSAQALPQFWIELVVAFVRNPSPVPLEEIKEPELLPVDFVFEEVPPQIVTPLNVEQREPEVLLPPAPEEELVMGDQRLALPQMAFGALKWEQYFGLKVIEPPLPPGINDILAGTCPFFSDKKVSETHLLTLIPEGMTLEQLETLMQNPKQGNKIGFRYKNSITWKEHSQTSSGRAHWALMTNDVVPESRSQTWDAQKALVAKYSPQGYELPSAIDVAASLFLEYIQTEKRFYTDSPYTYTRCVELVSGRWPMVVGGFAPAGLYVSGGYDDHVLLGVGAVRKSF